MPEEIVPNNQMDKTEADTRNETIDRALRKAGWIFGKDWTDEVRVTGMNNTSGRGFVDYVLWSDNGKPLAIVEAKRYSVGPETGRIQARGYADLLEKQYGRRPIIFFTNGYEYRIWDDRNYPERRISTVYSKKDLDKLHNLESNRSSILHDAVIDDNISNRYYQKDAIRNVCTSFETKHRKALLVMATGSGKTRTVISLVQVLMNKGWIKNVLFLADRTELADQAKKAFTLNLPNLSVTNIAEEKFDYRSRCIISTYQTMINLIDKAKDENGDLVFTSGHFDLIITDEAHRSIYNRYRAIFEYFDSLLVGLTATPKDDVDKNTYEVFGCEDGDPTYAYDLAQAIKDRYLVDYYSIEVKFKFLENGIVYLDLTEDEKEEYEEEFLDPDGALPERMDSSALNDWIFNKDTIVKVLDVLMTQGHRVDFGSTIGKTIIFAKNHNHAEHIKHVFDKQYPHLNGQCQVIDNHIKNAKSLIDDFKDSQKNPRIAISVDMMDTGIDVPEVLNLVFFKKVYSKSKFWQMIGRGTRLCPGLIDGNDKTDFYIFDFCSNFEFFSLKPRGKEPDTTMSVQSRIFNIKLDLIWKLNNISSLNEEASKFREDLVTDVVHKIKELNRDNFAVAQHLRCLDMFSDRERFDTLSSDDVTYLEHELVPLIEPYRNGDIYAITFDSLMYKIELCKLSEMPSQSYCSEARKRMALVFRTKVPAVQEKKETISLFLRNGYLESCDYLKIDSLREELRDIMHFMEGGSKMIHDTNFKDDILETARNGSNIPQSDLQRYRDKAEYYLREHKTDPVIKKLHTNEPLNQEDIKELESILWERVGSKEDYVKEIGDKPLGVFVREINGLDENAAKETFSRFLNEVTLSKEQTYFVNQIVEYVVQNGIIEDMRVLTNAPFTEKGSIPELFGSDMNTWNKIKSAIDEIDQNAETV